jgi:hypothetical protein
MREREVNDAIDCPWVKSGRTLLQLVELDIVTDQAVGEKALDMQAPKLAGDLFEIYGFRISESILPSRVDKIDVI